MAERFKLPKGWAKDLISFEKTIKYDELPNEEEQPFRLIEGFGSVLLSAPHGAKSYRNNGKEIWHEEDEYTAGLAFLLHDITRAHVIATTSKTAEFDPNFTKDNRYKDALRDFVDKNGIEYVVDLHGAAIKSEKLSKKQLVDIGVGGRPSITMNGGLFDQITEIIETRLGKGSTNRGNKEGFDAVITGGTITSFCYKLGLQAIQIEMKPQVRVVKRLRSATLYKLCGEFEGKKRLIAQMIKALGETIIFLNSQPRKKEQG
jgi:hypothetical protein